MTITHPEMTRYFMTIPEAVQLVLQASLLGQGSEIFMLDMGKPVRILDLAKGLIQLSGRKVGQDIEIVFSGIRPGEKLHEELYMATEEYKRTKHEKIFRVTESVPNTDEKIEETIEQMIEFAQQLRSDSVVSQIIQLIPGCQLTEYAPVSPPLATPREGVVNLKAEPTDTPWRRPVPTPLLAHS